jgi:hypothetical protein
MSDLCQPVIKPVDLFFITLKLKEINPSGEKENENTPGFCTFRTRDHFIKQLRTRGCHTTADGARKPPPEQQPAGCAAAIPAAARGHGRGRREVQQQFSPRTAGLPDIHCAADIHANQYLF